MKILVMGLPGSGKTTLAKELAQKLNAIHLNADVMRNKVWTDLDFSLSCRLIQAQRMGALSDVLNEQGLHTIADFVCPTEATREQFGDAFVIWVDRIDKGRFEDTNKIFEIPSKVDIHIPYGLTLDQEVQLCLSILWSNKRRA